MGTFKANNPINSVDGAYIPVPVSYKWNKQDISDSAAGRTEDSVMQKNRVATKVTLELSWDYLTIAEEAEVLKAFAPEYVNVKYLDAEEGTFVTKVFYVGDRAAPIFNAETGRWGETTFNIIER